MTAGTEAAAAPRSTLSVALCTYNGAAYLAEQLASIAGQDRPPDELVVCDDGSSDDTAAIVAAFARDASFPVAFHTNAVRLGSTKNFERAISLATGDVIALADQDDVWRADKLAVLERAVAVPGVGGAFSDARLVDGRLRELPHRLWDAGDFTGRWRERFEAGEAFSVLVRRQHVTGATFAFRAAYRPLLLPISAAAVHDAWIALLLSAVSTLHPVDEPLIDYRQHGGNQIGASRMTRLDRLRVSLSPVDRARLSRNATWLREALGRLRAHADLVRDPAYFDELAAHVEHLEHRATLPARRAARVQPVRREFAAGAYHRFGDGLKSAVRDFLL